MTQREKFDLLQTEIGQGTMLIEASAGTGKTYTIAGLVLRLLIERPELTIDRILVTTFTELATAELRSRIRGLLRDALLAFQTGKSEDDLLREVLTKYTDHRAATARMKDALAHFDEAPIYTIHGFCQRVLSERAFESGALFDRELVTSQTDLLREVAYDFWRTHFYDGEAFSALLALKNGITPETLLNDLDELTRNPTLQILPNDWRPLSEIVRDLNDALTQLRQSWAKEEKKSAPSLPTARGPCTATASRRRCFPCSITSRVAERKGRYRRQLESIACLPSHDRSSGAEGFLHSTIFGLRWLRRLLDLEQDFSVAVRAEFFAVARTQYCGNETGAQCLLL